MDTIVEDYEFLDLSDASDVERSLIKRILVRPAASNRPFQVPWVPPLASALDTLPPPPAPAAVPPLATYHAVQMNGGGTRPVDEAAAVYQPPPAAMLPPPVRPVVQLNPQAGVFVNTQPFPPPPPAQYAAYPPQTPPGRRPKKGRDSSGEGGGASGGGIMPHVIWNPQPTPFYPQAAPIICGPFSPAAAYVPPPVIDDQDLKEQVPYNHHHHNPHHPHHYHQEQHIHHQHHHHHHHHHQPRHAPIPAQHMPVPAPVTITAPVTIPVAPMIPPQMPQMAKFTNGNQVVTGGNQLVTGSYQVVNSGGQPKPLLVIPSNRMVDKKPVVTPAPPSTAVKVKSVSTVTVKDEKQSQTAAVNSIPAAASANMEQPISGRQETKHEPKSTTQQNNVAAATAKPVEVPPTQPVTVPPAVTTPVTAPPAVTTPVTAPPAVTAAPPQVTASPVEKASPQVTAPPPQVTAPTQVTAPPPQATAPSAVTVPPPQVTAPPAVTAPAAPTFASLFSNSSSSRARYSAPASLASGGKGGVVSVNAASPQQQPKAHSVATSPHMTSSPGVSPLVGDPGLLRLAEYLSTYKLDHRAALLRPRGLTNRSNYCYINATLQALLACPPLYNLLRRLPLPPRKSHAKSKSSTPIIDSMVQFVSEFDEMPAAPSLLKSRREKQQAARDDKQAVESVAVDSAFEPTYMYRMMHSVIRNESAFPVEGRQEDAEEFLSCLLNGLNDEMVELLRLTDDNLSNGDVIATNGDNYPDQDSDNEWKEISKKKPTITRRTRLVSTPLSQIFQGQVRSRVVRQGASETDSIQPFFTLPLDIEKASSVKEALENIPTKNMLEGFTCPKTNRTIEAYQQLYLEELPLVLLLHLKCFDYRLHTCSKIIKNVEFTIELKIDAKLMAGSGKKNNNNNTTNHNRSASNSIKEREYKLFAVVYHDGKEATKGHYVTDVYHVGYGTWLRYDDANVRPVSPAQVLAPRAPRVPYLLYYRRKDTIASASATPHANHKPQKTAANES